MGHQLLTLGEDSIFFATGFGALAALNRRDGTIRWIVTYEVPPSRSDVKVLSDPDRNGLLPCVYDRGSIIAVAPESGHVMCYGAETGLLRWEKKLPDTIRHLLGTSQDKVFVSGRSLWSLDLATGRIAWRHRTTDPADFGYGRGLLADNFVVWPTRERILFFNQATGYTQRVGVLPLSPITIRGGNLLMTDGVLLITRPREVIGFPSTQPLDPSSKVGSGL